jgi:hypothetical protein
MPDPGSESKATQASPESAAESGAQEGAAGGTDSTSSAGTGPASGSEPGSTNSSSTGSTSSSASPNIPGLGGLTAKAEALKKRLFSQETKWMLAYYLQQAQAVLLKPAEFYEAMPREGGYTEPMVFLCISGAIFGLLQAIGHFDPFEIIFAFVYVFASVAIGAYAASHVLQSMGGKGTPESTFRVIAYSKATLLFAWINLGIIPLGGLAAMAYQIYISGLGIELTHGVERKKAMLVMAGVAIVLFLGKKLIHL